MVGLEFKACFLFCNTKKRILLSLVTFILEHLITYLNLLKPLKTFVFFLPVIFINEKLD